MSEADLQRQLNEHREELEKIGESVANLRDNHISHLTGDVKDVQVTLASVKSDLKWIKIIGGFLILQSVAIILKIFIK